MEPRSAALIASRNVANVAFLSIYVETFQFDGGSEFERVVIRHPGAVAIVPVTDGGVLLVKQFRAPLVRTMLEIPAGKLDVSGESPSAAAARECEEETGCRPGNLEHLRTIHTTPGFTDERIELFVAYDLIEVGASPQGVEEHHSEVVRMSFREVRGAIADGSITDAKTLLGLNDVLALHDAG